MDHSETDKLLDLVTQKHARLEQLVALARSQLALVQVGDFSRLMRVLAVKQRLLEELAAVERSLDPFRRQSPDARHWRSVELRRQCATLADAAQALLVELLRHEKQCEAELSRQRDDAAQRLQGMHTSAQVGNAYVRDDVLPNSVDLSTNR